MLIDSTISKSLLTETKYPEEKPTNVIINGLVIINHDDGKRKRNKMINNMYAKM